MNYKIHNMAQKTKEWDETRTGKVTASVASKMITPTGKPSAQADGYIGMILAEGAGLQQPEFIKPTYWMERGINLEPEARGWFQVETGLIVQQAGFIESLDRPCGFSPDGYTDISIEGTPTLIPVQLKVPKPSTHIRWFLEGGLPKDHKPQCHFEMSIVGAPYMYFMSYNPQLTPILVKVERDEYTTATESALKVFLAKLEAARTVLLGDAK